MTSEMDAMKAPANDEFDLLLNDVLRIAANPELPARVKIQTRIGVFELTRQRAEEPVAAPRPPVIFAPDIFLAKMQPKRNTHSTGYALLAHAAAVLLMCWAVSAHVRIAPPATNPELNLLTTPPPVAPEKRSSGGGGGAQTHEPASKGQLPKFAPVQITPPKIPVEAKVHMPDPALEAVTNMQMANPDMPNFGMPNSNMPGASLGEGRGTGIGSGNGPGLGAGSGGNYGGAIRSVGGGVSEPIVIHEVQPEFSEEARRAKFPGVVTVNLIVDTKGMPQNVHVIQGVGMGLDEKAIEAVKQYRFKPAMENGQPVPVYVNVVVSFQIE